MTKERYKTVDHKSPGSPEAAVKGCTCDPKVNCGGRGLKVLLEKHYLVTKDCPLHDREKET